MTSTFITFIRGMEVFKNGNYSVRKWTASDRDEAAQVIKQCLEPYGLQFEPQGADLDAIDVEEHYLKNERGEFWVVIDVSNQRLVGTGAYYEVSEPGAVEIRKMYLLPEARGKKLGRYILEVRTVIGDQGLYQLPSIYMCRTFIAVIIVAVPYLTFP